MKKFFLLISLLLSFVLHLYSQDVQFSPAILSSGGGSTCSQAVNLSRWRIGEIHVVTFSSNEVSLKQAGIVASILHADWSVSVYPNPVVTRLKIQFDENSAGEYVFEVTDITGTKLIADKARLMLPGQVKELDFTRFGSGLYLLKIIPLNDGQHKLFKIIKR